MHDACIGWPMHPLRLLSMKKTSPLVLVSTAVLGVQALLFSGCASGYQRSSTPAPATAMLSDHPKETGAFTAVNLELTADMKAKLKDTLKFDEKALHHTIELALTNNHLLNVDQKQPGRVLNIAVTDVRVRNTFNAVMWGFMSGNDHILGEATVKDSSGAVADQFTVKASYALGGIAGGQDTTRMNWLYEAFAKEVVKALGGDPDAKPKQG